MTTLLKTKIAGTPSDFSNPVLDVNDKRLKAVYSWILNTKNEEAIDKLSSLLKSYNVYDLSSMLKLIHGKKQVIYSKLKEIADSISSKFSTQKTSEEDEKNLSVDSAIELVKSKLPVLKKILNDLKFSGTFTKSTYGKDWLVQQSAEGIEKSHRFIFRSSGILLYTDFLKSFQSRYDINGFLILPLGSSESSLSGNKLSDIQISFYFSFTN